MRLITWALVIVICLSVVLGGCGKKDADGVVKDLDKIVTKLESYQGSGTMTLHTGISPRSTGLRCGTRIRLFIGLL